MPPAFPGGSLLPIRTFPPHAHHRDMEPPLPDLSLQPAIVAPDFFWQAASLYAEDIAANLSSFWASGSITVDGAGRLLLPDTLPHVHDVSAYGYKVFVDDGCCMIAPGHQRPRHGTKIGVALGRRVDGLWQMHPSLFVVTSFAAEVRRGIPRCFADHPPSPVSTDREDPAFPLWALPRAPKKDAPPVGIPSDVLCDLHKLALGALASAEDHEKTAFCVQIARVCDEVGPRFTTSVRTSSPGGTYNALSSHPRQEAQIRATLQRWIDEGRLSPKAAFCHPNLGVEYLVEVWAQKDTYTSHARLEALAYFLQEAAALPT